MGFIGFYWLLQSHDLNCSVTIISMAVYILPKYSFIFNQQTSNLSWLKFIKSSKNWPVLPSTGQMPKHQTKKNSFCLKHVSGGVCLVRCWIWPWPSCLGKLWCHISNVQHLSSFRLWKNLALCNIIKYHSRANRDLVILVITIFSKHYQQNY